jgi:FkbM family methyltransferase
VGPERSGTFPEHVKAVTPGFRLLRRAAGAVYWQLFPTPEVAAWRHADQRAAATPRFTPGSIRMLDYELQYSDLLTFCPQWHDIFIDGALEFRAPCAAPRILDCGGNVGLASLFFKRRFPGARITAYEADPALFAMMKANLAANGASDVETVQAALWTANGRVMFRVEGSDSGMIDSLSGAVAGMSVDVPSVRLRDVIANGARGDDDRIDLLKLDIEGAENAVLADCEPVLDRVGAIVMDLHEFAPTDRQAPRVFDLLTRSGFTYAVDEFVPQPWRPPVAPAESPFPGKALVWSMTVKAWRA